MSRTLFPRQVRKWIIQTSVLQTDHFITLHSIRSSLISFILLLSILSLSREHMNSQLTLLPMCGFAAQLVEHRNSTARRSWVQIPLKPEFFQTSLQLLLSKLQTQLWGSSLHLTVYVKDIKIGWNTTFSTLRNWLRMAPFHRVNALLPPFHRVSTVSHRSNHCSLYF